MTNPETLKDILRDAKREIETWPLWMRTQEPTLCDVEDTTETTNSGQLNPAHSRWLQGLPTMWDDCAVMATPSSRRSQRRSSKPISKRKETNSKETK